MFLSDVRHQDAAIKMLTSAASGGRVAHAYLFAGPPGVGKRLAAHGWAKLLLCENPAGGKKIDACGSCRSCHLMDADTHPDFHLFQKEPDRTEFRISLITPRPGESPDITVNQSVQVKPMMAERIVTVLDDAEMMNEEAANAFLKTLEEAPTHTVLILLASDPSRLPETIASRCQPVRFQPLPEEFIAEKIRGDAPADAARYVSRFASGSIEVATELLSSGLFDAKKEWIKKLGRLDVTAAFDLADEIIRWVDNASKERVETKSGVELNTYRRRFHSLILGQFMAFYRDALLLKTGAGEVPLIHEDQRAEAEKLAAELDERAIGRAIGILERSQRFLDQNVHIALTVENSLVQLSQIAVRPVLA